MEEMVQAQIRDLLGQFKQEIDRQFETIAWPENRVRTEEAPGGEKPAGNPALLDRIAELERRLVIADPNRERPHRDRRERQKEVEPAIPPSIKLSVPAFQGTMNPSTYLDWERKIVLFFQCGQFTEG
ncbi:unnamed protein product [Linum trigynum]|uniref:Uncharacterized protein n=1 Tax=Linum trigynum TaxID=586398 RepID=A0AAV2CVK3_9ROSI